jgi:hypothetical protein
MKTALTFAVAVALALALFVRALVYAVVDAVHLLADRKKRAISVNKKRMQKTTTPTAAVSGDLFGNLASV